ncbi:MAG: EthD family reductase [Candidatus Babeliales bacterium]
MFRLTVTYATTEDGYFDFDYYINVHLPLATPLIGESVVRTEVTRGVKGIGDESSPYAAVAHIYLKELEGIQAAFLNHGDQIMEDVPKFTNIRPVLNLEEIVSG